MLVLCLPQPGAHSVAALSTAQRCSVLARLVRIGGGAAGRLDDRAVLRGRLCACGGPGPGAARCTGPAWAEEGFGRGSCCWRLGNASTNPVVAADVRVWETGHTRSGCRDASRTATTRCPAVRGRGQRPSELSQVCRRGEALEVNANHFGVRLLSARVIQRRGHPEASAAAHPAAHQSTPQSSVAGGASIELSSAPGLEPRLTQHPADGGQRWPESAQQPSPGSGAESAQGR